MIIKILKNVSGSTLQILNRDIENNDSYDIPSHLWLELSGDAEIRTLVEDEDIIVNDGTNDLDITEGLNHLSKFQEDSAGAANFSYEFIDEAESIKLPFGQQMTTYGAIDIEGVFDIEGTCIILDEE